jgi:hypothetical protein
MRSASWALRLLSLLSCFRATSPSSHTSRGSRSLRLSCEIYSSSPWWLPSPGRHGTHPICLNRLRVSDLLHRVGAGENYTGPSPHPDRQLEPAYATGVLPTSGLHDGSGLPGLGRPPGHVMETRPRPVTFSPSPATAGCASRRKAYRSRSCFSPCSCTATGGRSLRRASRSGSNAVETAAYFVVSEAQARCPWHVSKPASADKPPNLRRSPCVREESRTD